MDQIAKILHNFYEKDERILNHYQTLSDYERKLLLSRALVAYKFQIKSRLPQVYRDRDSIGNPFGAF